MSINLASPAPIVETAVADPIRENSSGDYYAEPAKPVEEAVAAPALPVEPAETVDNAYKFAPSNAFANPEQRAKMSVESLRRDGGVDFESRAAVARRAPKKNFLKLWLPMFFDQRDFITFSEISRFAVIKGGCCFIFLESTDLAPLYAFALNDLKAEIENRDNPDKYSYTVNPSTNTNKTSDNLTTVLLRDKNTNQLAYQFTFDTDKDKGVVKRFFDAVQRASPPIEAHVVDAKECNKKQGKGVK